MEFTHKQVNDILTQLLGIIPSLRCRNESNGRLTHSCNGKNFRADSKTIFHPYFFSQKEKRLSF